MDILDRNGPLLGAGHRLFGDKENVPLLHMGGGVLHGHLRDAVPVLDDMGLDAEAAVIHPIHRDDLVLPGVDHRGGFHFHNAVAPLSS